MKSIYVLKSDNKYKIGVSADPVKRLKQLKIGCPNAELIYYSHLLSNAFKIESLIHKQYEQNLISNEWFVFADYPEILSTIENVVSYMGNQENIKNNNVIDFKDSKLSKIISGFTESEIKEETEKLKIENEEIFNFYIQINGVHKPNVYSELVCKTTFNKSEKEMRDSLNISGNLALKLFLDKENQLEYNNTENLIAAMVINYWGYDQIKDFIQQNNVKKLAG